MSRLVRNTSDVVTNARDLAAEQAKKPIDERSEMPSSNPRWPEQVRLVRRPGTFFGVGIATRTPAPGYEREYELETTLYVPFAALQEVEKDRDWAKQNAREAEWRQENGARHWAKEIGEVREQRDAAERRATHLEADLAKAETSVTEQEAGLLKDLERVEKERDTDAKLVYALEQRLGVRRDELDAAERRVSEAEGKLAEARALPRTYQRQHVKYGAVELPLREVKALLTPPLRSVIAGSGTAEEMNAFDAAKRVLWPIFEATLADSDPQPSKGHFSVPGTVRCTSVNASGIFRCECAEGHDGYHVCVTPRRTMKWPNSVEECENWADSDPPACTCGHEEDDHEDDGECVEGCDCEGFDPIGGSAHSADSDPPEEPTGDEAINNMEGKPEDLYASVEEKPCAQCKVGFPHSYPGAPGHNPTDPGDCFTSDCRYGCGCWAGQTRSGGPDGIDPFGECPKHPDRPAAQDTPKEETK